MLRKTKESDEKNTTKKTTKKATSVANKKENIAKKNKAEKKENTKKSTLAKESTKKSTLAKDSNKKIEKNVEKKESTSKASKKKNILIKKLPLKKSKKTTTKKDSKQKEPVSSYSPEYYDLPFRYNQTIVTILAQTPNNLFIYWDISDGDRQKLNEKYGEYFFEITKPVLIIYNETMNYSFEVDIDDFANSWYLHINDSDCAYKIELGRRPIPVNYDYIPNYDIEKNGPIYPIQTPYIHISSSNEIVAPNDKILFNLKNKIKFRNVKTQEIIERDIKDFPNLYRDGKFINIFDLFDNLYQDNLHMNKLDLNNPSSKSPSSESFLKRFS